MRYLSLFSGIEAATAAWEPLGWEPMAFAEIDEFPAAVLAHRLPDVPNLGDVTKVDWRKFVEDNGRPDVLVGGSPCFPAGTLVLTDKRFTPIEDIRPGDMVLTHKGRFKRVVRVGGHRDADTVLLKGQGVAGLECTPNHPLWSIKRLESWNNGSRKYDVSFSNPSFVHAEEMQGRMWLNVTKVPEFEVPAFAIDEKRHMMLDGVDPNNTDLFYFVGRWLGDGCVFPNPFKPDVLERVRRRTVIVSCGRHELNELRERFEKLTFLHFEIHEVGSTYQFIVNSKQLYEWITENFGALSHHKYLPTWAMGMRRDLREALLSGYLDADGCVYDEQKGVLQSTSVNKELTLGMKVLAGSLGKTSSVCVGKPRREDCVIEGRKVNESQYFVQRYRDPNRLTFFDESNVGFWGRVRSVTDSRKGVTVYNLEVEDDHSYTADGIASSNCQSFSLAGGRASLDGESNLMFEYIRACREVQPEWFVWENVPGVLNTKDNAFKQLIDTLQDIGYVSLAWRVLDAEFVRVAERDGDGRITGWVGPVAQRRRRVFLVGHLGAGGGAAAVLFEPESVRGNTQTSKQKREELAADAGRGAGGGAGGDGVTAFKHTSGATARSMPAYDDGSCNTLTAEGHSPAVAFSQNSPQPSPKGQGGALTAQPVAMASGQANAEISEGGVSPTLSCLHEVPIVVDADP